MLKFLVAQIKKAIADAQSGNKVAFATGKVWIFSATHSDEVCVFIFYHICNLFLSLPATLSLTSLQCIVVFILYIEVGQLKCFSMTYSSFLCYSKTKCSSHFRLLEGKREKQQLCKRKRGILCLSWLDPLH